MIFARTMHKFYIIIARKYFSRILGGTCPCPPPRLYTPMYIGPVAMPSFMAARRERRNSGHILWGMPQISDRI